MFMCVYIKHSGKKVVVIDLSCCKFWIKHVVESKNLRVVMSYIFVTILPPGKFKLYNMTACTANGTLKVFCVSALCQIMIFVFIEIKYVYMCLFDA